MKSRMVLTAVTIFLLFLPVVAGCAKPAPTPTPAPKPAVTPTAPPAVSLRFSSPFPETHLFSAVGKFFMQRATEKTGGRITFAAFYGGTLTPAMETLDAAQKRVADIILSTALYAPGKLPLGTFEFNFLFNDPDLRNESKIKRGMYERIPALNGELAKFNVAPSPIFGPIASYDILSRQPIRALEDLKGKRIGHTPAEYVPAFRAAGAVSVLGPATEFYERLERGVVDAVAIPLNLQYSFKLHEVAKHHTTIGFNTPVPTALWINMDTWKALTPKDQALFVDIGRETDEFYIAGTKKELEEAREAFRKAGVTFYTLPAADTKKWVEGMPDLPADWARKMADKGLPGWEIVDAYLELSKKEGWNFPRQWGVR